MDLSALRVFERVAATGSFTTTARHFNRAVSSISRQVRGLEEAVGQPLLYRHTRAVTLTERACATTKRSATLWSGSTSPRMRINAPVAFGQRQIVSLLHRFQARHPVLKAELQFNDRVVDPVREGHDVTFRVGELSDSSLIARRLAPMNYVIAAAPSYLQAHGDPESPESLIDHNCLLYQGEMGRQRWYFQTPDQTKATPLEITGNLYSGDAISLVQAAYWVRGW